MKETLQAIQQSKGFDRIRTQLNQYMERPIPARKGWVYRAISSMEGYPAELVTEAVLKLIDELGQSSSEHRHYLSYWRDRLVGAPVVPVLSSKVYGKWSESQIVAETLPLSPVIEFGRTIYGFKVDLSLESARDRGLWIDRGFLPAVDLPIVEIIPMGCRVKILSQWEKMAENGYAEAVPLQWHRQTDPPSWTLSRDNDNQLPEYMNKGEDRPGLYVDRSIVAFGFWKAYRWWQGCRDWYFEKHPEWFWDDPAWGSEIVEPIFVPEGAAVISPSSLKVFQELNLTG